ncbi:cell surface glycoprotein CD200 receptor 1-B-like [Catharus ustulatus]|uniref:Ig-like domain-containing protein n=1 Tax=Catharus ustulatus TaxID=91951 RepID=A0A8C3TGZ8_CATUS|nr:cell surface glycoprotein CD200 receptor 1-B-like [Catharus ustulatus]XP_032939948.1 cell surface glycoprotein CD200 receptor 1-B-like [Catharus ustulatus]XP_032939955.1 cell surface glycoprotein CD200 receptor 1-B-like [Catharus ustulatus]
MAQKQAVLAVLLFLPINLVETHNRVSVEAGHEAVLSCPKISKVDLLLVTWKMNCSTCCVLSYRRDKNEINRNNCSERITWKYSPDSDPALRIYPVNLQDEGNYTCQIASVEGNFDCFFSLTVIVPPTVTLTHDTSRVAVCQATAGKPPADISWIPASNHSSEEEFHHPNGTVTRVSYFGWTNSSLPSVTCLVTHPAMNQTLDLDLRYTSQMLLYILIGAAAGVIAVTGVTLCLIFRCRACWLDKRARRSVTQTNTCKFPSSCVRRLQPPEFPERIYENDSPRSVYICLQQCKQK